MRRTIPAMVLKKVNLKFPSQSPFADSSLRELLQAAVAFKICSIRPLVSNARRILPVAERLLTPSLLYGVLVKHTVFAHFCAGETEGELRPAFAKLAAKGIGPILDYAAEAAVDTASAVAHSAATPLNVDLTALLSKDRNIVYGLDTVFDENVKLFESCIDTASSNLPPSGVAFTAVKVTALCDPQLLARTTAVLLALRQSWGQYFIAENQGVRPPLEMCRDVCGLSFKASDPRRCSIADFRSGLRSMCPNIADTEVDTLVSIFDRQGKGHVHYFDYTHLLRPCVLEDKDPGAMRPLTDVLPSLTPEERRLSAKYDARIDRIVQRAVSKNVRVLVDAEQTYYQMAIDSSVRQLQRKYNRTAPIVYNTYQAYLKFSYKRMVNDVERAKREGYIFAAKFVRGAYMDAERADAARLGYECPICPTKAATHVMYDTMGMKLLDEVAAGTRMGLMFGTHNINSLQLLANRTVDLEACDAAHVDVTFAQLYGMSDHLTIVLAAAGHKVFKYVPYGPVKETIFYLLRRAEENKEMMKQTTGEWPLIRKELKAKILRL